MPSSTQSQRRGKRKSEQSSACAHPASISIDGDSGGPHAGQHFCVMCGARLKGPILDTSSNACSADTVSADAATPQTAKAVAALGQYKPLTGSEAGIMQYTTDLDLFVTGGSLKSRCTDFVVEEIRWDGSIVSAKSTNIDPKHGFGYWHRGEGPVHDIGETDIDDSDFLYEPNNTRFILVKANCSTFEAIRMISAATGIPTGRFTTAGLKDTKAVTAQEVIAIGASTKQLIGRVDNNPRIRMVVDPTCPPTRVRLFPGSCNGNRFRIVLRDVPLDSDAADIKNDPVLQVAAQIRERGFVNYFGEQRFGGNTTRNTDSKWRNHHTLLQL